MTREEAIECNKNLIMYMKLAENHHCKFLEEDYIALDMAIKALEQEPKYCDRNICIQNEYNGIGCGECEVTKSQEPCEDAISRDKTIVQLKHLPSDWDGDWKVPIRNCIETVKSMPPVTPQPKTGRWKKMVSIYDVVSGTYTRVTYTDEDKKMGNMPIYECECGRTMPMPTNYCPDCGAKMEVDK